MKNEICTISLPKGVLDNDYIFYTDGTIKHFYDQSIYQPNKETMLSANDIDDDTKNKLLEKCPVEFKEKVSVILNVKR